ncbi:hypothetical protein JTE90_023688 [Oedothorax gibbosus]|uniref:C2H2-type domain-containing protein n=1 Tax=Oedothorax gibbosus TaxID=931172 RepID=A0AAV6TYH3_9ARAC|nr:hypothetical protein JTE90_023688 [Oedothorax gibbosus]
MVDKEDCYFLEKLHTQNPKSSLNVEYAATKPLGKMTGSSTKSPISAISKPTSSRKLPPNLSMEELITRNYRCGNCDFWTNHLNDWKLHEQIKGHIQAFYCPVCDKKFTLKWNMKAHFRLHTGEKRYRCLICWKILLPKRPPQEPTYYRCANCSFKTEVLAEWKHHEQIQGHKQSHNCPVCEKSFTLKASCETVTFEDETYYCRHCSFSTPLMETLKNHELNHFAKGPLFACEICQKTFNRKFNLKAHMRIHSGEKPFKCKFCGAQFTFHSSLKSHIISKHPHVLQEWDAFFFTSKKTSSDPPKVHYCEYCPYTTHYRSHWKRHQLVHTQARPHVCKVCNKSFNHKVTLTSHSRLHTGEKPFACDVCPCRFTSRSSWKLHLAKHG